MKFLVPPLTHPPDPTCFSRRVKASLVPLHFLTDDVASNIRRTIVTHRQEGQGGAARGASYPKGLNPVSKTEPDPSALPGSAPPRPPGTPRLTLNSNRGFCHAFNE